MRGLAALFVLVAALLTTRVAAADSPVRVGSKRFVESYVLAEIATQLARSEGLLAEHRQGLGGTAVTFRAVEDGSIDVYPEYTGTLAETVVKGGTADLGDLRAALAPRGLTLSAPLGFDNTYALALTRATSARLGVTKLSQLAAHPELRAALSNEFMGRSDGWPGLSARYGLHPATQRAIDHALAYEAIARGDADVIDVYTTDAKIERFDLVVLEDDLRFFPRYEAVLVVRSDLAARAPAFARAVAQLEGSIDVAAMRRMNARAELDGIGFPDVAAEWLRGPTARGAGGAGTSTMTPARRPGVLLGTLEMIRAHGPRHVMLVGISLLGSTIVGIPLGVIACSRRRLGALILGLTGIVQTIPALALFCFMIPLLGIGPVPALAALFLYGLLPIVRNTHAGLVSIPGELREAAVAISLTTWQRLLHVELPLASRTIVAGVKTSAVVGVGSATIAAFIGAGGFGEPISTGLSLNDVPLILEGAIPAAGLALVVEGAFSLLERWAVPRGLRHGGG
ncbi:MAG: L-proline glycine betaine binding transporter protein ProX [Labilithrix sp.]|nr:L-proline glycine betaine binding transporter protein ProX [Labilithrix sp.]